MIISTIGGTLSTTHSVKELIWNTAQKDRPHDFIEREVGFQKLKVRKTATSVLRDDHVHHS